METEYVRGVYYHRIHFEGMTAREKKEVASGITLYYGIHQSPFGKYLLALHAPDQIHAGQDIAPLIVPPRLQGAAVFPEKMQKVVGLE